MTSPPTDFGGTKNGYGCFEPVGILDEYAIYYSGTYRHVSAQQAVVTAADANRED